MVVTDAAAAIDFYRTAFSATELMRIAGPDGKVGHAEFQIGNSRIMISDEYPQMDVRSPQALGGSPVSLYLYVDDVDATVDRAARAGAKVCCVPWRTNSTAIEPVRLRTRSATPGTSPLTGKTSHPTKSPGAPRPS
jgi:uncharacterized glyoxalase superfamily protein PhnB